MNKSIGVLCLSVSFFVRIFRAAFSLFSMKAPKGSEAMSGMASAAVATFLVEAVHRYISGDLLGVSFLGEVGSTAGSLGGVAAAIMVPIMMGVNPVYAVVAGAALGTHRIYDHSSDRSVTSIDGIYARRLDENDLYLTA